MINDLMEACDNIRLTMDPVSSMEGHYSSSPGLPQGAVECAVLESHVLSASFKLLGTHGALYLDNDNLFPLGTF